MTKTFRNGPVGAMLDEYERAVDELKALLLSCEQNMYSAIIDPTTDDPDCISMQAIMNHVVRAGYGYSNYIRKHFGNPYSDRKDAYDVETPEAACEAMDSMMQYTAETLADKFDFSEAEVKSNAMMSAWGQQYDLEQMLEHAIVHILRHRRQIERFRLKFQQR